MKEKSYKTKLREVLLGILQSICSIRGQIVFLHDREDDDTGIVDDEHMYVQYSLIWRQD